MPPAPDKDSLAWSSLELMSRVASRESALLSTAHREWHVAAATELALPEENTGKYRNGDLV